MSDTGSQPQADIDDENDEVEHSNAASQHDQPAEGGEDTVNE